MKEKQEKKVELMESQLVIVTEAVGKKQFLQHENRRIYSQVSCTFPQQYGR